MLFGLSWCREGSGTGACPWVELWVLKPDAGEAPVGPHLCGTVLALASRPHSLAECPVQVQAGVPGPALSWAGRTGPAEVPGALKLLTLSLCSTVQ